MLPDSLPLLNCYYSVRSCCVFLKKGSYFISSFCLWLNVSAALSAIFARFNSLLHPNKNIHPLSLPITHVGPRKIATSSIGLISLNRFSTAVSPRFSGSLSWTFHQLHRIMPADSLERGARMCDRLVKVMDANRGPGMYSTWSSNVSWNTLHWESLQQHTTPFDRHLQVEMGY